MDRRQIVTAILAIVAGCAAVAAVGVHQRSARRARLASVQFNPAEPEDAAWPVRAPARAALDVQPATAGADQPTTEPSPTDVKATVATAADPPRAYYRYKKRAKPQFDRDARRMSDSPRPRQATAAAGAVATVAEPSAAARRAVSLVGVDSDAEAVWADAINDPSRAAHERQDLIEDLNEDGFPDPKHVTADDLPLIESRLALIEQFAPEAMDDVNAAAFAEAYKDLVNMYGRAVSGSDEP